MILSKIEDAMKYHLERHPALRRSIKHVYQRTLYTFSKKRIAEGDIERITPDDGYEYFFGYYDKCPWDKTGRYMLCLRAKCTYIDVAPKETADIMLIDTEEGNRLNKIAETRAWCVQQGAMLQWLGPDEDDLIIYNDFRSGNYCSVVFSVRLKKEMRTYSMPIYALSSNGDFALSLDFSRLHRLRPGYGYSNIPDITKDNLCPRSPCIWNLNLSNGVTKSILSYSQLTQFEPRKQMQGAEHKVNHIMINPSGDRFMVLHRWFSAGRKYSRLITADQDGKNLFNLSDEDFVSHCCWKNDREILSFLRHDGINGYVLMKDQTNEYYHLWPSLNTDGHCTYSPDGQYVITDTYPNKKRLASVYLLDGERVTKIACVLSPFRYDNDTRCDLHPRWDREGKRICFDSTHEGKRGVYVVYTEAEK